jgi:3-hydroxybutyryl-CoA dehydrogenase
VKLKLGIIGSGQMGQGIAQVSAVAGHNVFIYDTNPKTSSEATENIAEALEKLRTLGKVHDHECLTALSNLQVVKNIADLQDCELVIEAVVENYEVKHELFKQLSKINQTGILATNTSSLSVNRLAEAVDKPERFIGLHFMNPVQVMPLVEVIHSKVTGSAIAQSTLEFCQTLGKTPVECKDQPGFIVNRILLPMINQAICSLDAGLATAHDIDLAMKLGGNFPMGPLTLADLIGLDTCLAILETLDKEGQNLTFPPSKLLKEKVAKGKLGKKTKAGFFTY